MDSKSASSGGASGSAEDSEKKKEGAPGSGSGEDQGSAGGSEAANAVNAALAAGPRKPGLSAWIRVGIAAGIFVAAGATLTWFLRPGLFKGRSEVSAESNSSAGDRMPASHGGHSGARGRGPGLMAGIGDAFKSLQGKAESLREAHEQNRRLALENANLRLWVEQLRYDCSEQKAEAASRDIASTLEKHAGAGYARVLNGIRYSPPAHLLPPQLYTLGVSYFKAREFEKAAVIFHFLTNMAENDAYRTPKNLLLAGVAWYELDHYQLADDNFGKVLEFKADDGALQHQAQARLWRALVAERLNQRPKAQYWMKELVDHHPHSREAEWVNSGKSGRRMPSSEGNAKGHDAH